MKGTILMRVFFCKKIQCPFMCFCKHSSAHIYNSGPLKLENSPHIVPSTAYAVSDVSDKSSSGNYEAENVVVLKSCIRKPDSAGKKRVQWKDKLGKELYEIKEFESSETEDTDNEVESSHCLCIIL